MDSYYHGILAATELESFGVLGANDANVPIGDEPETKMVKNTMEFVSLEKALAADWTSLPKSRFKRMDASAYFLLMTIFEFQSR